jgi:hypothetical protein
MKEHIIPGGIAAAVAAAVAGGGVYVSPKRIEQVQHSIMTSKHAWPDLTDAQKAELAARLKAMAPIKFEIVSADASSVDLAQDLDDAAEDAGAGVESVLDRPASPLGYGIGVQGEAGDTKVDELAAALKAVTGREVAVIRGPTASSGYPLWILIGKEPRR